MLPLLLTLAVPAHSQDEASWNVADEAALVRALSSLREVQRNPLAAVSDDQLASQAVDAASAALPAGDVVPMRAEDLDALWSLDLTCAVWVKPASTGWDLSVATGCRDAVQVRIASHGAAPPAPIAPPMGPSPTRSPRRKHRFKGPLIASNLGALAGLAVAVGGTAWFVDSASDLDLLGPAVLTLSGTALVPLASLGGAAWLENHHAVGNTRLAVASLALWGAGTGSLLLASRGDGIVTFGAIGGLGLASSLVLGIASVVVNNSRASRAQQRRKRRRYSL